MVLQAAIFELNFTAGQLPDSGEAALGFVQESQPFTIRCVADDSFSPDLYVNRHHRQYPKEYNDASFEFNDEGVYECGATSLQEPKSFHVKRIRIKSQVCMGDSECSLSEQTKCHNGICSIITGQPTCYCPSGFTGTYCETDLARPVSTCPSLPQLTFVFFLVGIITAILGILLIREKRKTRKLIKENSTIKDSVLENPENPYKELLDNNGQEEKKTKFSGNSNKTQNLVADETQPLQTDSESDVP